MEEDEGPLKANKDENSENPPSLYPEPVAGGKDDSVAEDAEEDKYDGVARGCARACFVLVFISLSSLHWFTLRSRLASRLSGSSDNSDDELAAEKAESEEDGSADGDVDDDEDKHAEASTVFDTGSACSAASGDNEDGDVREEAAGCEFVRVSAGR